MTGRVFWVVLGCLVCQLGLGFGYVFGPLAKDILAEFGWTRAETTWAVTIGTLIAAASAIYLGKLLEELGIRPEETRQARPPTDFEIAGEKVDSSDHRGVAGLFRDDREDRDGVVAILLAWVVGLVALYASLGVWFPRQV